MSAILRVIAFFTLATIVATAVPALSATERFVTVKNSMGESIEAAFLQPAVSTTTTVKYGNIGPRKELLFNLDDQRTTILVRSSGCSGTTRRDLPNDRRVTVTVGPRCTLEVSMPISL